VKASSIFNRQPVKNQAACYPQTTCLDKGEGIRPDFQRQVCSQRQIKGLGSCVYSASLEMVAWWPWSRHYWIPWKGSTGCQWALDQALWRQRCLEGNVTWMNTN